MGELISELKPEQREVSNSQINVSSCKDQETNLLFNNKEYLDQYFGICKKYQEKRSALSRLKINPYLEDIEMNKLKNRISELDNQIKNEETGFWAEVDKAQQSGVKFGIEEIASKYKLELFEKKVMLFLLYLENFEINLNVCTEDELLTVFDVENSFLTRMRNYKYFMRGSGLRKNRLMILNERKSDESAKMECLLSDTTIDLVSNILSGENIGNSEIIKYKNSETIGYIKDPEYKIEDVELTDETKEKVVFFLDAIRNNSLEKLGASKRIKKGLGSAFLFFGPPGTGKSMLAEAVASYVGKKVLVVEYPKIMESHVGETDKNIAKIFRSAEEEDLVILLDEADTLFYTRRFAFQEHDIKFVNEMLQELEKFKGIIVLTTNMETLLDPALERRLALKVKFDLPSKELRQKIWQLHIPEKMKVAEGVNFEVLASKYNFSGGNIKNAMLHAFRKVASKNSDTLTQDDLVFGANMERDGMFKKEGHKEIVGFVRQ